MKLYQELRRAQTYEQDQLAEFCAEAFHASPEYFLRRWNLDPEPGSFGLLLEDEGEVVGYVHVYERVLRIGSRGYRCAGIGNVAVSLRHRGRGYSMTLLENCLHRCVEEGFELSLLYTHLEGLYERLGYRTLPFHEVDMPATVGQGWYLGGELSERDREHYTTEHAWRPGTVERDERYWKAREGWLRGEGWGVLRHREEDGYCLVKFTPQGGLVDEATGGCGRRLDREAPRPGTWRRRLPNSAGTLLGVTPPRTRIMARALTPAVDIDQTAWADGVFWETDAF